MARNIFPSANDVSTTEGNGKTLSEEFLTKRIKTMTGDNFVASTSAFDYVSDSSLNVEYTGGEALVDGYYLNIDTNTTLAMTASATNYVYYQIDKDALDHATTNSDFAVVSTSTVAPSNSILLSKIVTSSSTVDSESDERQVGLDAGKLNGEDWEVVTSGSISGSPTHSIDLLPAQNHYKYNYSVYSPDVYIEIKGTDGANRYAFITKTSSGNDKLTIVPLDSSDTVYYKVWAFR